MGCSTPLVVCPTHRLAHFVPGSTPRACHCHVREHAIRLGQSMLHLITCRACWPPTAPPRDAMACERMLVCAFLGRSRPRTASRRPHGRAKCVRTPCRVVEHYADASQRAGGCDSGPCMGCSSMPWHGLSVMAQSTPTIVSAFIVSPNRYRRLSYVHSGVA